MKNTFAVTMTLLLALTLGGSYAAYQKAVTPHEAAHAEPHAEPGDVPTEEAPSPNSAATGTEGAPGAQGDVTAENSGGTQGGENGAVAASGEGSRATGEVPAASQEGTSADTNPEGQTGQAPEDTAAAAETQGDTVAGGKTFAASCAGCHGANGEGGVGPALNAANGPKSWTLEQFTAALREGQAPDRELAPMMPRFTAAQLTDADIANVFTHVKSLN